MEDGSVMRKKVLKSANEWLRLDTDPTTRADVQRLLDQDAIHELQHRLFPRISVGTAGLRARVEAGFARMNWLVVTQTSQGLAQHLVDTLPNAASRGIVLGFDGRRDSRRFAEAARLAFSSHGFKIFWYNEPVHTPLVPFGVRLHKAAAGVMITASHNPKDDNGYKVYGANGCQINDPEDKAIAKAILAKLEPVLTETGDWKDYRPQTVVKYFDQVAALGRSEQMPRFVYSPMHGVGLKYLQGAVDRILVRQNMRSELSLFEVVAEQAHPDPNFPTVLFPNPEEEGALDLAKCKADREEIDLIIANDPDADRLAVAQNTAAGWYQFKGDEIGVLLGYYLFQKLRNTTGSSPQVTMLNSAVSSQMLAAIGKVEGFDVEETLTGFKWLGNRALQIGESAVFAYEEALGYLLPSVVYDKDGIAAAILLLQACSSWNSLPYTMLQGLYQKYGYFETTNTYWKSPNMSLTQKVFDHILENPQQLPLAIGEGVRSQVRNLVDGTDTSRQDGRALLPSSPENLMITLWMKGDSRLCEGVRCTVRASGTEPKLKVYVECQGRDSRKATYDGALLVLRCIRRVWFCNPRLVMEGKFEPATRP